MPVNYNMPRYSDGIKKKTQTVFKGLNHTRGAGDGEIYDMLNMSGDEYPLAVPRKPRECVLSLEKPNGITAHDGVYFVDGVGFYCLSDGEKVLRGTVSDTRKRFAHIGAYVIILPDKAYYNRISGEFGSLEASWEGTAAFCDGTFAGIEAEGCRIVTEGAAFPFMVGDAVSISGATDDENNVTLIIREISDDKQSLGFYEHSFTTGESQLLTIKRSVPDIDYICENENRLWGCKGDTIYASKPGDPFNWNVFDGLKNDSYALTVGSAGDFTGCISYLGYPIFFKEEKVYKVYGSKPSDFQVMSSASIGVMRGAADTLAIAGETLYYLSHAGIMAYNGGVPECVSMPLGDYFTSIEFMPSGTDRGFAAGSDGVKYYISLLEEESDNTNLFVFDTRSRMWYREDSLNVVGFAREDGLYSLSADGELLRFNASVSNDEAQHKFNSMLEFADFTNDGVSERKITAKLGLRVELEEGASLSVEMSFDDGKYILLKQLRAPERVPNTNKFVSKKSYYLPLQIKRCDHFRVRLSGVGVWRLYSLTREFAAGSELN